MDRCGAIGRASRCCTSSECASEAEVLEVVAAVLGVYQPLESVGSTMLKQVPCLVVGAREQLSSSGGLAGHCSAHQSVRILRR